VRATRFNVFSDAGTGTMDWDTPVAQMHGLIYLSAAFAHDTVVQFGVRAVSPDGDSELNTVTVSGTADAQGPAAIEAPQVSEGDDE
jgi:hypothetical protein